jgi:hypothetical protein
MEAAAGFGASAAGGVGFGVAVLGFCAGAAEAAAREQAAAMIDVRVRRIVLWVSG